MEWNPEAEEALQSLKSYLASPPVLVAPMEKEPLLLYIAATNQVVSAVLVAERDASPKMSSKGKRLGDPFPRQSRKKGQSGVQGFEDPNTLPLPSTTSHALKAKKHTPRRRSRGLPRQHPGTPRT